MHIRCLPKISGNGLRSARLAAVSTLAALLMSACATDWQNEGSFSRTAQSQLNLQSTPPGKVFIDNKYMGETPIVLPIQYGQEVERKTRKVTYWDTQPGLALLISLASLGLYIPFSLIPVDTDTSLEPRDSYTNNHFGISIQAPGYDAWKQELVAKGEPKIDLQPQLVKTSQTARLAREGH